MCTPFVSSFVDSAKRFEAAWWCGLGRIVAVPLVGQIGGKFFFNGRIPFTSRASCRKVSRVGVAEAGASGSMTSGEVQLSTSRSNRSWFV